MCQAFVNLGVALRAFSHDTLYVDETSEAYENNNVFMIAV